MAHEYVEATPSVLRWARQSAGYTVDDVAKKLGVKPDRVTAWEEGTAGVTEGRLDALADLYKRPTVLFFVSDPPTEQEAALPDFRSSTEEHEPSLKYQIRHARERRELALELIQELARKPPEFEFSCDRSDEPSATGAKLRRFLGFNVDQQLAWKRDGGTDALNHWKDAAERSGALVFQASMSQMPTARGFSIYERQLPVAVLRSSDTAASRCFTLMHELAHLGLKNAGICDLHDDGLELFCNEVAAAALMPKEALDAAGAFHLDADNWSDSAAQRAARSLSVSEQALALRLARLGRISWEFYRAKHARYELLARNARENAKNKEQHTFVPPHRMAVVRNGRAFTRLVLDAYHERTVTAHRASQYLNVGFPHFHDIEIDLTKYGAPRVA